jgi:hypothetical protein
MASERNFVSGFLARRILDILRIIAPVAGDPADRSRCDRGHFGAVDRPLASIL